MLIAKMWRKKGGKEVELRQRIIVWVLLSTNLQMFCFWRKVSMLANQSLVIDWTLNVRRSFIPTQLLVGHSKQINMTSSHRKDGIHLLMIPLSKILFISVQQKNVWASAFNNVYVLSHIVAEIWFFDLFQAWHDQDRIISKPSRVSQVGLRWRGPRHHNPTASECNV